MKNRTAFGGFTFLVVASALTLVLAGCSGNEGAPGTPGPGVTSPGAATALNITVTSASVSSAPVMKFTVTNQDNSKVAGLTLSDLRFTIAKLVPGSNGGPSKWQNYINTQSSGLAVGFVRGNRESNGTLVDHQDGTYTYTFSTDITDPTKTCIAPCVDADGNPIDTSYNASLTHRVAVQTRGALPMVNGVYTFRPSDGATTGLFSREIVKTESCNECHNKLELHDARIETQYCVMCHNPGSTGKGTVGTVTGPTTVDFKVMIHKIHNGADLASVTSGGDYGIFGYSGTILSFKDVHFPQDIRNCTKCHDGAKTAQGDNWKNQPSKAACGACHDAVYFGTSPDPTKAYQTESHIAKAAAHVPPVTVGPDPADDTCIACHSASGPAGSIEAAHEIPGKAAQARFKFNIISVTGGTVPVIQISVTDPTNNNAAYDIASGDATSNPIFKTSGRSRLALDIAWFSGSKDIQNTGSGTDPWGIETPAENIDPGKPLSIDPVNACDGTPITDWSCTSTGAPNYVYTLTKLTPLPAAATGTGRVAFEGHPAGQDANGSYGPSPAGVAVVVKSEYKDFAITGTTVTARRQVVDIDKCNQCHEKLTLHGSNRTSEPQVCVVCHNPNLTDITHTGTFGSSNPPYLVGQRGRPKVAAGLPGEYLPLPSPLDGKIEESADFKRMIHAIHAAARTAYPIPPATTGEPAHGFREKGIQVRSNDFSHIRFPGILNDCLTCHRPGTYELTGTWENPTLNGILSTSVVSTPSAIAPLDISLALYRAALLDQTDDYRISPTAAVCSSCHDGDLAKVHMRSTGGAVFGDDNKTQSLITSTVVETCVVCHGRGKVADVRVVHGVP